MQCLFSRLALRYFGVGLVLLGSISCAKKDVKTEAAAPPVAAAPEPPPPVDEQNELHLAYFDFDKATLTAKAKKELRFDADWLKKNASVKVVVEGHCDDRGSESYNQGLGQRRADAVKQYLTSHGIARRRLVSTSFGFNKPADPGHNEEAWAKNRRASFRIQK